MNERRVLLVRGASAIVCIAVALVGCGGDPDQRTGSDTGADALRIDGSTPPPPPGDSGPEPMDQGTDFSVPLGDGDVRPDDSVPPPPDDAAPPPPPDAPPGPPRCGTRGAPPCADNAYCDFPDGTLCGAADEGGVCTERPTACDDVFDPVCGCDGNTYGNACEAASRGVDVATRGECGSTSLSCVDTRCEAGLTCIGGPSCGGTWSCAALGRLCTDDLVPYCSCNGTTFEDSSTCPGLAYAWMGTCERPLGLVSCDRIEVFCRRVEPTCPAGQAPSVLGTCWGPCVPIEQCRCTPGEIRDTCPRGAMGCGPEGHCMP